MFILKKKLKSKNVVSANESSIIDDSKNEYDLINKDFYGNVTKYDFVDESIFESTLEQEEA